MSARVRIEVLKKDCIKFHVSFGIALMVEKLRYFPIILHGRESEAVEEINACIFITKNTHPVLAFV